MRSDHLLILHLPSFNWFILTRTLLVLQSLCFPCHPKLKDCRNLGLWLPFCGPTCYLQSVRLSPESLMPRQITTARSFPRLPQTLPRFPLKSTTFLLVRQAPLWFHPRSCTLLFICLMIESPTATTCFFLSRLWSSPYFNFLWKNLSLDLWM